MTLTRNLFGRLSLAAAVGILCVTAGVFLYSGGRPVSLLGVDLDPSRSALIERPEGWGLYLGGPTAVALTLIGHLTRRATHKPRILLIIVGIGAWAAYRSHRLFWDEWFDAQISGLTCGMGAVLWNCHHPCLAEALLLMVMVSPACVLAELLELVGARFTPSAPPGLLLATGNLLLILVLAWCFAVMPCTAPSELEALAFTSDGELILSAHRGGTLRLWRVLENPAEPGPSLTELERVRIHRGPMRRLSFALCPGTAAVWKTDGTVDLWQAGPFLQLLKVPASNDKIYFCDLALSPDGKSLLATGPNRKLHLWDLDVQPDGRLEAVPIQLQPGEIPDGWTGARFSADSRQVVCPSKRSLSFFDRKRGTLQSRIDLPDSTLFQVETEFSPDGRSFAAIEGRRNLTLIHVPSGAVTTLLGGGGDFIRGLAFSPDGKELMAGCNDRIKRWQTPSGRSLEEWTPFSRELSIKSLAYSPDGRWCAAGLSDGRVVLRRRTGSSTP